MRQILEPEEPKESVIIGLAPNGDVWRIYKHGLDNYVWDALDQLKAPTPIGTYKVGLRDSIYNALTLGYNVWVCNSVEELIEVLQK